MLVQAESMNIAVAAISVASECFMVVGVSVYEGKVNITFLSCNSPWALPHPRVLPSKGYCPRQNKFAAPWARTLLSDRCERDWCPR